MNSQLSLLKLEDERVVWKMLMYAAHESSLESVRKQPNLAQYASDWGRDGDMGYVALLDGQPVGAAWLRLWLNQEKGFGYINDSVPELAIAVLPKNRGQGIGTKLITQVLKMAQKVYPAVSLSVRSDNPAIRLYQRLGFVKVEDSEKINRTGGNSFNMIYQFSHCSIYPLPTTTETVS